METKKKKIGPALLRLPGYAQLAGIEYEMKLAALVALRARAKGLKFELYLNARAAHPFDDLVLRVLEPQPALYLVQLKQSTNKRNEKIKDFTAEKGHFSLKKCFSFFENPFQYWEGRNPKVKPSAEEMRLLQEVRQSHTRFLLCTTNEVEEQNKDGAQWPPDSPVDSALEDLFFHRARDAGADPGAVVRFNHTDTEVWNLLQEESYRQFLSQFVVFCKQGKGSTMDKLIVTEMTKVMGYSLPRPRNISQEYVGRVKMWGEKEKGGICLSEELPELGEAIATVLRDLGMAATCCESLRFTQPHCAPLVEALHGEGPLRMVLPHAQPGLRAAKVLQVCEEVHRERWTYVDEAVLHQYSLEAMVAAASVCKVVVLDADGCPEGTRQLLAAVGGSVQLLQLCSSRGQDRDDFLGPSVRQLEDDWRMEHLTVKAQETLLDRQLKFQGTSMRLRDLEATWPKMRTDVDAALLGPLARGDAVLGAALPISDNAHLHLPRAFQHFVALHASILKLNKPNEHLALQGANKDLLTELRDHGGENDRWSVLPLEDCQEAFTRLCEKYYYKNVHWVWVAGGQTLEDADLEWRATSGLNMLLESFVQPWSAQCVNRPLCVRRPVRAPAVVRARGTGVGRRRPPIAAGGRRRGGQDLCPHACGGGGARAGTGALGRVRGVAGTQPMAKETA